MAYQFFDAYGSVLSADSSIISGTGTTGIQRPIINIGSVITPMPVVFSGTASVSGTLNIGSTIAIGNTPSVSGTVDIGNIPRVSVHGAVSIAGGTVGVTQVGAWTTSVVGAVSIVGGTVGVTQVGAWTHSVVGAVSIVGGFVGVTQVGVWATSVVGGPLNIGSILSTYAEDTAHSDGNAGLFTLGVRNDKVASFVSANLDYTPIAVDAAGRNITKPFAPDHASTFGVGSVNGAASVILMSAPGTGLKNYLTDFTVANTGATTTLIRITAGGASVLGYTIAPAGGGSNMIGLASPISAPPNSPINFAADTASSVVYGTAYGYVAP